MSTVPLENNRRTGSGGREFRHIAACNKNTISKVNSVSRRHSETTASLDRAYLTGHPTKPNSFAKGVKE